LYRVFLGSDNVSETFVFWALFVATGTVIILLVIKGRFPALWKRLRNRLFSSRPPRPQYSRSFPSSSIPTAGDADPREIIQIAEEIHLRERRRDTSGRNRERILELRRRLDELQPDGKPGNPAPPRSAGPDWPPVESPAGAARSPENESLWRVRQLKELEKRLVRPAGRPPSEGE
jgi:hypothetical protein